MNVQEIKIGLVFSLCLMLFTALASGGRAESPYTNAISRAGKLIEAHREATQVPGVAIAVSVKGEMIWSEGFGYSNLETRHPATPLTRFRIGSVSKALTAVAIARLYEKGIIDIDAPIQRYVSYFPEKGSTITIRQLGGHLAGIRHYADAKESDNTKPFQSVKETINIFGNNSLVSKPGEKYNYSSYGFQLLAAAIEGATGKDFLEVMQKEVFEPTGMNSTVADNPQKMILFRTEFYDIDRSGKLSPSSYVDLTDRWAGGGFLSNAEDLARLGSMLLDDKLLGERGKRLLFTSQKTSSGEDVLYGFGFGVYKDTQGRLVYHHGGNVAGGRSHLVIYPEERVVLGFASNMNRGIGFNQGEALGLAELFFDEHLPASKTDVDPTGAYTFTTVRDETRFGGERSKGRGLLTIYKRGDEFAGTLIRGNGSAVRVPFVKIKGREAWAIAVPGSWIFMRLRFTGNGFSGEWEERGLPSGRFLLRGSFSEVSKVY